MHKTLKTHNASRGNVLIVHLSEKLNLLCVRFDLTQERIGEQLNVAHTTVGRWLKGTSLPYKRHALKLAELYDLKPEELLDDNVPLPARITDGRGQIIKRAAEQAKRLYPNNPEAGQEHLEGTTAVGHWKIAALDTAESLRQKATELIMLAERLERPFLSSLDQGRADLAALEKSLDQPKVQMPVKAHRRHV